MEKLSRYLFFIICFVFFVFTGNYFTKVLVNEVARSGHIVSNPVFTLKYVQNTGAAFSLMQNAGEFLIILAVVVLTLIFMHVINHVYSLSLQEMFFIALFSAGIAGNLHERIVLGFVRDFFKLNFVDFPIFNIHDIFITAGLAALMVMILARKIK